MGKSIDDFEWLKRRLTDLTDNTAFKEINLLKETPVLTFRPGAWTMLKEMLLAYYAPNYLRILRNQSWISRLVYVDMFSGSGVIGIEGLKKNYLGSPLVITSCIGSKRFDSYYFMDLEEPKLEQLRGLFNLIGKTEDIKMYPGDSNVAIKEFISDLQTFGTHSLIFIDPFATEIEFDTIRLLGSIGCDLIVNVATEEIFRSVKQWQNNRTWNSEALDKFFGSTDWKLKLEGVQSDEEIFNYYSELIMTEAYKKRPIGTKIQKTIDGHHYFILFTSTWGKGEKPPFFRIVEEFNQRIQGLSGQQILAYMQHYTEGGGIGLSEFLE